MPNHCWNKLVITGDITRVRKELGSTDEDEGLWKVNFSESGLLDRLFPMPEELKGTESPTDSPNWYDWASENWGTKWGDYDTELLNDYDNTIVFLFQSAWAPPTQGISNVAAQYPEAKFRLTFQEPGMCFKGSCVWENGELNFEEKNEYEPNDEVFGHMGG